MTKDILLVDDLLLDVMLTRRALDDCTIPHRIVVACDGEEAWQLAGAQRFDLILLDLKMPRVDGFELLGRLREHAGRRVPAIVLSGSNLAADRSRADALGAIEYVHKALDYTEFRDGLKAALGRHGFC
ncbi:response regulator [Massilia sp. G4R7]|uniref:Response regulator n=1 Tax=Massilia phyllostachyos TaxID=2898585 RepID=A0ABS8Q2X7_9BURK|nr:response regulator [Massilia phyllostachyos]MCD2516098.1 response regulator [Massilia phyllostachyos]